MSKQTKIYESAKGDFMVAVTACKKDDSAMTLSMYFNEEASGAPDDYYGCYFDARTAHPVLTDGTGRNGRIKPLTLEKFKDGVYKTPEGSKFFALLVHYKDGDKVQFFGKNKSKSFLTKQTLFDQTPKFAG